MQYRLLSLCMMVVIWLAGCAPKAARLVIEPVSGPAPWTGLDLNNASDQFQFAIVTDRTGGHRPGVFMDGVRKLNLLQPEFVMSVGDLIEGYTEDLDELNRQWDEFDGFVKQLEMPFFYLPGNHDITNQTMLELWQKRLGKTYYHFVYQDVLFLCLNSEDQYRGAGRGTISDEQFAYVERVLAEHQQVRWTLVFLHQPLWHQGNTERWPEVEQLLAERKHTVFAGHEHSYKKADRNNGKYFTLATTGGGSGLRGPQLGEFDHLVWVTMTDQGPIIANLLLSGIWDENVMTEDKKDLIREISRKSPVQIEPLYLADLEGFSGGKVKIRLTNDEDIPMQVRFDEQFSWDLIGAVAQSELTVSPNSVVETSLSLQPRAGNRCERPARLTAHIGYDLPGKGAVEIPYTSQIKPLPRLLLTRQERKPEIDGKDQEWGELRFGWDSQESDLQIRFDVRYDDAYVYVAARVKDDTIVSYGKGAPWRQDGIGFGFSAKPFAQAVMSKGTNWYADEIFQQITPATDQVPSVMSRTEPESHLFKCVQTPDGYFLEAAFDLNAVKALQGPNWKTLRFNIMVDDKDGQQHPRTWWHPNWMNSDNLVGSGMFFRP